MKLVLAGIFILLGLSACAPKKEVPFYDRANSANDKSVSDLEK
ncbi:MAG: hypothetical protein U9O86_10815 [Campylobacterota bacterium]|nr:hypothetical protein [Campylobacterota bacterium]